MANNQLFAGAIVGAVYFPFAALFYQLSGECLMYKSNRLYRALITLRHGDWYEARLTKTIELLDLESDTRVLEVGCGPGKFSKRLMDAGADLKAIDINEKFICKLQEYDKERFELCSVTELTYPDNSFDRVTMFDVLHHIPDYMDALSEIQRVLKPGGYAIIWEGSEPFGEDKLPEKWATWFMHVLDGETNHVELDKIRKEFKFEEIEPFGYRLSK